MLSCNDYWIYVLYIESYYTFCANILFSPINYLFLTVNSFIFLLESSYFFTKKSIISCNSNCLFYNYIILLVVYFISFMFKLIFADYKSYIDYVISLPLIHLLHSTICSFFIVDTYFMFCFNFSIYFYFWYIIFISPFSWFSNDALLFYYPKRGFLFYRFTDDFLLYRFTEDFLF